MNKFDGFIFDIDGTLTSTNNLIFATFNHITKKYLNRTYSDDEIIEMFGPTEDVIMKDMMGDKYLDARKDYFQFYSSEHNNMATLFPGIENVLKMIKSAGKPIGIYTGKGRDSSIISLTEFGIIDYFDVIVTGDDIEDHKPSPEGIEIFIQRYNLDSQKVLMIGDAPADIKAARSANSKIASVLWDSYAKDLVLEMESDYYFNTVDELQNFIKEAI